MKTKDHTAGVYDLADRCGVGIGEACTLAGIASSTPPRWRRGHKPQTSQLSRLRVAIIEIARERGTLPADLIEQSEKPTLLQRVERIVGEAQAVAAELKAAARKA